MTTQAPAPNARIFQPPNRLKNKVGRGAKTLPPRVLAAFEALMEGASREYAKHLDEQIEALRALAIGADGESADTDAIFAIAHQIRGEAKTFGFNCVGCMADQLCDFLEARAEAAPLDARAPDGAGGSAATKGVAVVALYVHTLAALKTTGDAEGEDRAQLVAKVLGQELTRAVHHVLKSCTGADCPE